MFFSYTPTGTAGAADYFSITGIQLEKGSAATSFEMRPYAVELQLCQRYCVYLSQGESFIGISNNDGMGVAAININLQTPMRIIPVLIQSSVGSYYLTPASGNSYPNDGLLIVVSSRPFTRQVQLIAFCSSLATDYGCVVLFLSGATLTLNAEM